MLRHQLSRPLLAMLWLSQKLQRRIEKTKMHNTKWGRERLPRKRHFFAVKIIFLLALYHFLSTV